MNENTNLNSKKENEIEDVALRFLKKANGEKNFVPMENEPSENTLVDYIVLPKNDKDLKIKKPKTNRFKGENANIKTLSKGKNNPQYNSLKFINVPRKESENDESIKKIKSVTVTSFYSKPVKEHTLPKTKTNTNLLISKNIFKDLSYKEINKILQNFYIPIIENYQSIFVIQNSIKENLTSFHYFYNLIQKNEENAIEQKSSIKSTSNIGNKYEDDFNLKIKINELIIIDFSFLLLEILSDSQQSDLKKYFNDGSLDYLHKEINKALNILYNIKMLILLYKEINGKNEISSNNSIKNINTNIKPSSNKTSKTNIIKNLDKKISSSYVNIYFKNKDEYKNEKIINNIENNMKELNEIINNFLIKIN